MFWKNITPPKHKTDLVPQYDDVIASNSESLPFKDGEMKYIMYDPPFVLADNHIKTIKRVVSNHCQRFDGYKNFEQLKSNYYNTLKIIPYY
jgi:hypothetical protein